MCYNRQVGATQKAAKAVFLLFEVILLKYLIYAVTKLTIWFAGEIVTVSAKYMGELQMVVI